MSYITKELVVESMKKNGLNARIENGVVMIIVPASNYRAFEKAFCKSRRIAKEIGYANSIGIRCESSGENDDGD